MKSTPVTKAAQVIRLRCIAGVIFAGVAVWLFLLVQGMPIGDADDWDHILGSVDGSWGIILKGFLTPWSTSIHWTGQADRYNELFSRRVFLTVFQKTLSLFVGIQPFPHYFLKSLFFAGSVSLFFVLLRRLTCSLPFALAGTLFYLLVPAHYPHVLWLTDPITIVHCLMLAAVVTALPLFDLMEQGGPARSFMARLGVFLALGFVAMKTKEPALSLPLALGAYTALRLPKLWRHKTRLLLWGGVLAFLVFQIVPVQHVADSTQQHFHFRPERVLRFFWLNHSCGYMDEKAPALFSLDYVWAVSIARTFGFFLLWMLIFSGVFLALRRGIPKDGDARLPLFFLCWVAAETPFMIFFEPDPRYFSGIMIPLTALAVLVFKRAWDGMPRGIARILFTAALLGSLGWALAMNMRSIVWLRLHIGERNHRFYHTAETLYRDAHPQAPQDERHIGLYYGSRYVPEGSTLRMENDTFFVGLGYETWNRMGHLRGTLQDFEKYAPQGYVYYVDDVPPDFAADPRIKLIRTLSGINEASFLERFLYGLKGSGPVPFYIYKWVEPSPGGGA